MSRGVQHRKSVPQSLPVPENTIRLHTAQVALGRRAEPGVLCPDAHGVRRGISQRRGSLLWQGRTLFWQTLPLPEHWLALTATRPLRAAPLLLPLKGLP